MYTVVYWCVVAYSCAVGELLWCGVAYSCDVGELLWCAVAYCCHVGEEEERKVGEKLKIKL